MTLKKCLLTRNDCYNQSSKIKKVTGIVVHSTGANNPTIKRYVQPLPTDKDYAEIVADLGKNVYNNHWNKSFKAKEINRQSCVHAFIGKTANGQIATYQTLPFDICCWGCGSGKKGSYNYNPTAHIQFEICEAALTDKEYFAVAFREAAEFCAYLCKQFNLSVDTIVSHKGAHNLGYGNNHGDPDHWLKVHNKTMNDFRNDVRFILNETNVPELAPAPAPVPTPTPQPSIKVGDKVKCKPGVKKYSNGKAMASWVPKSTLYVREIEKSGKVLLVSTEPIRPVYTGRVNASDVEKI